MEKCTIIEAARTLYDNKLGSMSPTTVIRYYDIYNKYLIYRIGTTYSEAVTITAERCYCSTKTVEGVITWANQNIPKNK